MNQAYLTHPDNIQFNEQVDILLDFGLSQAEIARILTVTTGQVSRVKKGERHATRDYIQSLRKHIGLLEKSRANALKKSRAKIGGSRTALFELSHQVLNDLTALDAVHAFRDLFWARAAEIKVPVTRISISSKVTVPDGGVDASVLEDEGYALPQDELLTAGTRFQIKTGEFKPWQPSVVKAELFGTRTVDFKHLGAEIQNALKDGKRIVFICFGIDPVDGNLRNAVKNLKKYFSDCGYPKAAVEVWGQTQLLGLYRKYPGLCLRLLKIDQAEFRSRDSWACDEDMGSQIHYGPEHTDLIEELRQEIRSGVTSHLRLLGEPGVGKTRFALELSSTEDLAPVTLYVKEGAALLKSSFIKELLHPDDGCFVLLVVDECPRADRAEIWNMLKSRSGRIKLITIDHGPDDSTDELTRVIQIQPVSPEAIQSILMDHEIGENDAQRWAWFCEGSPRVAHVLGENLRLKNSDLLQEPTFVSVWNSFIAGYDSATSEGVKTRRKILRYISLFQQFGFQDQVAYEAQFIVSLIEGLTWDDFQSEIHYLKRRRIIQGGKTLYLTPRLFQIFLNKEFWDTHGSTFEISKIMEKMPESLWRWFIEMLKYSHESPTAEKAVERLLGRGGLIPGSFFPDDPKLGYLIQSLSEACPLHSLRCLQRTLGSMPLDQLRKLDSARQAIVWALERIAVWKDHFRGAVSLLLKLAEAENAKNTNNATGTFCELFRLTPGMACTEADPSLRFEILKEFLETGSQETRRICLNACVAALSLDDGMRFVGPEHQGLRRTIEFWWPKTYDELWNAYERVWTLLLELHSNWPDADRVHLNSAILEVGHAGLTIPCLIQSVMTALQLMENDPVSDTKSLIRFLQIELRNRAGELPPDVIATMNEIYNRLEGDNFSSRLKRYVKHVTWDDFHDHEFKPVDKVYRILDELADQIVKAPQLLLAEIDWLITESSNSVFGLGYRIAQRDACRKLLPTLVSAQDKNANSQDVLFLAGYLAAIFQADPSEWESHLLKLAKRKNLAPRISDLMIASGISDKLVKKVINLCRKGIVSFERLERWWFASQLRTLSLTVFEELISAQLEQGTAASWGNAVQMCHTVSMENEKVLIDLSEDLLFRGLTSEAMGDRRIRNQVSFYWSRMAKRFIERFPKRKWEFFERVLVIGSREWSTLMDLNGNQEMILTELVRSDPEHAFSCIAEAFVQTEKDRNRGLQFWLEQGFLQGLTERSTGPVQFLPPERLFSWVQTDVKKKGPWLARTLPQTFDMTPAGRLTRDFVARYGANDDITGSIHARFHSRGWCGNASDMYRHLREEAQQWLAGEKNNNVIRWLQDYIEGLSHSVERSEDEEERRYR